MWTVKVKIAKSLGGERDCRENVCQKEEEDDGRLKEKYGERKR